MSGKRQEILDRLAQFGQSPKRSLGQNFLVSETAIGRIIDTVRRLKPSAILEVGPGLGSLTDRLLDIPVPLTLIELDSNFARYWREREGSRARVVEGDALRIDWRELAMPDGSVFVGNLPYQISSSLVIERSLEPANLAAMVLMFQKEVAQRLTAKPKTKEYGLLTVIGSVFWDISLVLEAGPRDFYPPPNVASRVLMFRRKTPPPAVASPEARKDFLRFVKGGYSQRRKLLVKNLAGQYLPPGADAIAGVEASLEAMGLTRQARAEELDPDQFVSLYESCNGYQDNRRQ